jgi:hypothetical protein
MKRGAAGSVKRRSRQTPMDSAKVIVAYQIKEVSDGRK